MCLADWDLREWISHTGRPIALKRSEQTPVSLAVVKNTMICAPGHVPQSWRAATICQLLPADWII